MLEYLRGGREKICLRELENSAKEEAFKFSPERIGVCQVEMRGDDDNNSNYF